VLVVAEHGTPSIGPVARSFVTKRRRRSLLLGSTGIAPVGLVKQHIEAGKLRALAVTSERRLPDLPTVPTMAEAGYPKFVASQWFGVFGPAGMPDALVAKLNRDIAEIVMEPSIQQELARAGIIVATQDPKAFRKQLQDEVAYWTKTVVATGVKKD